MIKSLMEIIPPPSPLPPSDVLGQSSELEANDLRNL